METKKQVYRIVISKVEEDEKWAESIENRERRIGLNIERNFNYQQQATKTTDVLVCELTEEQYKKFKLEAIKIFE